MASQTRVASDLVQTLSWPSLRRHLATEWKQGEHVSIIAPNGGGKTYLALRGLLPIWDYTITLDAKREDRELERWGKVVNDYPQAPFDHHHYRVISKRVTKADTRATMAKVLSKVWSAGTKAGGWIVNIDELRLFVDRKYLNLAEDVERLWLFGRSRKTTLVAGTQAPRWVPAALYEQSKHHFIFQALDKRAIKRLAEIGGDMDLVEQVVPHLAPHQFLYMGPGGRTMYLSKVA